MRDIKSNFIVETAAKLFLSRSIAEVTIKDIAIEVGIGEATVYRYFGKKEAIVAAVALKLQEFVNRSYFNFPSAHNGFDKISVFYHSYYAIFNDRPELFRFIREFDSLMAGQEKSIMDQYEKSIDLYKASFFRFYQEGLEDGSVAEIENIETVYFASTHAILELCKKLSLAKPVLTQDVENPKAKEIKTLIDIILFRFSPCAPSASKNRETAQEEGAN